MKLRSLLFIGAIALGGSVSAQTWVQDSVTMGPGYANDIFYSMKNGGAGTEPNSNWQLGFQMTPPGPYGNVSIIANSVAGKVRVYSAHSKASANFASFSDADTSSLTGSPANILYNADSSWNFGAFNRMADVSNPFDYSWGFYDLNTHAVTGDSLYLIVANGAGYKVWVQMFNSTPADSVYWKFRIAQLDGTGDTTIKLYRTSGFTDRLFAYYDVTSQTVIDREPGRAAWDILFTRYMEYIPSASFYYPVTGVLSNFDVSVAELQNVDVQDTNQYLSHNYSDILNVIGSDWKAFNMTTNTYEVVDSVTYFIKTLNTNEYYQLVFTGFGGSANGKAVFKKRLLSGTTTGVKNPSNQIEAFYLVPNPSVNETSIVIDSKESANNARLIVADITGKVIRNSVIAVNNGMNAFRISTADLPTGTYTVTVTNGKWKIAEKLAVQY